MDFPEDDLFQTSESAEKPNKENAANAPYGFPHYLNRERIEVRFKEKEPIVDFIRTRSGERSSYKIEPGEVYKDGRTTCMIRNIPNKFSSGMLIDFMNQTHFGRYDFLYLRMDFKNRCNVGYAFVNFIDAEAVYDFNRRVSGQRWKNFYSMKVAELTYASVQGFESLVKKFKNSNVMMEDESFRPKIFYTEGEHRGYERKDFWY